MLRLFRYSCSARPACGGLPQRHKGTHVSLHFRSPSAATTSEHPAFAHLHSLHSSSANPNYLSLISMYSPIQLATFALALSGIANAHPGKETSKTPEGYGTTTTTTTTKTTKTTSSKSTCTPSTFWSTSVGETTKAHVKTVTVTIPGGPESTCKKTEVSTNIPKTIVVTKTKPVVVSSSPALPFSKQ